MKVTNIEPSDVGCRVIGIGFSPSTGRTIDGKHGTLKGFSRPYGSDVLHVVWDGERGVDLIAQDNARGTFFG